MDPGPAPQEFDVSVSRAVHAPLEAPEWIESPFEDVPEPEALESGSGPGADPALEFRRTLGMFATGVTVIATLAGDQVHGMTANAFMSVSLAPPLILVSVDRRARMNALLREGVRYGVSVLEAGQVALSDRFAGRVSGDAPEASFEVVRDTPLVVGALAHLVARVVRSYWGGDHSLFLGQVEYVRYGEGAPLLFHGGRYERLVQGARVLSALPAELLEPLLAGGEERRYAAGDPIMRRGEQGGSVELLLEGAVRVERPGRSLTVGPGELLGEVEVLDGSARVADLTAETEVRTRAIGRAELLAALAGRPGAAVALIELLAGRLRETG